MENTFKGSMDKAVIQLVEKAHIEGIKTGWDRYNQMKDICGFGDLGLCCKHCMLGPCRIDPFGEGPQHGICGIDADGMVARNLCRSIASGAAAHGDHGAHILEVFSQLVAGETEHYQVNDEAKLKALAESLVPDGVVGPTSAQLTVTEDASYKAYSSFRGKNNWMRSLLPQQRFEKLAALNVLPSGIDPAIRETLHRTHMGVDADASNLLLGALKCALSDLLGMDIATNLSDILFGTPSLTYSKANLGVLDPKAVNIAVHGHNPMVSEAVLEVVAELTPLAKEAGAENGINVVGICCTGNEVLLRHGVPTATNFASQELAIITGVMDGIVVDVQCIMPSLSTIADCYHTQLFTTMDTAKIPGATHVNFSTEDPMACARNIIKKSIEAHGGRKKKKIEVPDIVHETVTGFSVETILSLLSKASQKDPLAPFVELISAGDIQGVVLFAGCNNYKVKQDSGFIRIAEILAQNDILMLATGCGAGAFAKLGFLSPDATETLCGPGLKKVLHSLAGLIDLDRPLPPVWHMGSCVDNSRAARLVFALSEYLGVDVSQLPVMASAPEAMSEKALSIGTWAVTCGITCHLGVIPPVAGGKQVTSILTEGIGSLTGARFILETDCEKAASRIIETIQAKRQSLGLR